MSHLAAPETLRNFRFQRILHEDPLAHTIIFLGSFPDLEGNGSETQAIVRLEKTAFDPAQIPGIFNAPTGVERVRLEESTDIYTWMFGWLGPGRDHDLKINIICPATDVHIRKYTKQEQMIVRETPELYEKLVKPYINAFPLSRTQWMENLLEGRSEQEKVLVSNSDFIILPDMKWDLKTVSSLYLLAITRDRSIRSLRDIKKCHLPLLNDIRSEAERIVHQRWGLGKGSLRMFVHYQPSYYHFHVHIVNVNYNGPLEMNVAQAHLLDDIISLLELATDEDMGAFQKSTITYGLGDQHGLYEAMKAASM